MKSALCMILPLLLQANFMMLVTATAYTRRGDTEYKIYTEAKPRGAARQTCAADGGHLVHVKTEALHNFLVEMINEDADADKDYWIGLSHARGGNEYKWSNGTSVDDCGYSNWAPGEPANVPPTGCVKLWSRYDFKWDDEICGAKYYFICQKDYFKSLNYAVIPLISGESNGCGRNTDCSSALGVESGVITDDQFSASSSSGQFVPSEARLNSDKAWRPDRDSMARSGVQASEWLQIDLLERMSITGIQTQGQMYFRLSYYVTSYKLLYSDNGTDFSWKTFQENGSDKEFEGNSDADGVKTNYIDPPIVTRFIRLMPDTWRRGIAFRLELLGCQLEGTFFFFFVLS
ncbi:uncharacterized protein LOC144918499 [Branchiostoma floridae x Branchiostoma belcheri]